jgi:hypothetical protein
MKKLLNPIAHYNEYIILGIGLLSVVGNVLAGHFLQFKMVSILKFQMMEAGLGEITKAALISYGSAILALFLYGLWINRKTRILDIVNTVLLALIPPLAMLFVMRIPLFVQAQEKVMGDPTLVSFTDTVLLMLMALVALGLLAYFAVLLYRGFKTATNLKSTTQKVLFVVLLFVVATFSPYLLKL